MSNHTQKIKEKLKVSIRQLCDTAWMFVKNPSRDFTRKRKLPLQEVISILLCMEGGSLTGELLRYFGYSKLTASSSAFIQQRQKINSDAFPSLFDLFVKCPNEEKLYKAFLSGFFNPLTCHAQIAEKEHPKQVLASAALCFIMLPSAL